MLLGCILVWQDPAEASVNLVINQCVAINGSAVYTDRSCAAVDSVTRFPRQIPGRPAACLSNGSGQCTQQLILGVRPLHRGCPARSPESLRLAVSDAIANGDFNALAGLYNFAIPSGQSSAAVVRRLLQMAKRTASHVDLIEPEPLYPFGDIELKPASKPFLRVVQYSAGMTGPLITDDFRLVPAAGCLWLGS